MVSEMPRLGATASPRAVADARPKDLRLQRRSAAPYRYGTGASRRRVASTQSIFSGRAGKHVGALAIRERSIPRLGSRPGTNALATLGQDKELDVTSSTVVGIMAR